MPMRHGTAAKVNYSSTQLCGCVLPDGPHGLALVVLRVTCGERANATGKKHITLPSESSMTKITSLNT